MADAPDRFVSPCPPPTPYERELLTILMEECAEVQQRAAKMLRFGVNEVQPGQPLSNAERLADEVGDLSAMVSAVIAAGLMPWPRVATATAEKTEKLRRFMQTTLDSLPPAGVPS